MNEQEFVDHYNQSRMAVLRYALVLTQNKMSWAEDLTQTSWLLAWAHREQFRQDSSFSTWVRRILHNCYLSHFRNRERTMGQQMPCRMIEPTASYHHEWNAKLDAEKLLKKSPFKHASILRQCYLEDSLQHPLSSRNKLKLFRAKEFLRKRAA